MLSDEKMYSRLRQFFSFLWGHPAVESLDGWVVDGVWWDVSSLLWPSSLPLLLPFDG